MLSANNDTTGSMVGMTEKVCEAGRGCDDGRRNRRPGGMKPKKTIELSFALGPRKINADASDWRISKSRPKVGPKLQSCSAQRSSDKNSGDRAHRKNVQPDSDLRRWLPAFLPGR